MRFSEALGFPIPKSHPTPHPTPTALDLASGTLCCIPDNSFLHPLPDSEQVGDWSRRKVHVWGWSCTALPAASQVLMGSGLHTLVRTRGHLHYPNMEGEGPWLTAQVCLHFFPNRTQGFSLVFLEAPRYFLLQYTHICPIPFRDSIPRPPMLPFAFSCSQPRAFCSFSQLPSHLQITDLACFLESASQPGPLQPQRLPLGAFSLAISPPSHPPPGF